MRFRRGWFLPAALLALVPAALSAQKPIRVGPVIGLNLADVRVSNLDEATDINRRNGFLFGGFANFEVSRRFAIQPELLYSQQGAEIPVEDGISGVVKLDYIQIPVLAQLRFPSSGAAVPFLIAGPAIGFKASCKVKADAGAISAEFDCDDPDEDFIPFKSTDLSGVLGLGVEVSGLTISARYTHGFSNINNEAGALEKVRNRVFSVAVGFGFSLR
ncbi:MAG: porin family protein [Gemmatimonadales bacterium]